MILIVPAAGKSSRFPDMRPKWMLTHPNGNLMIVQSISGLELEKYSKVVITILKEHEEQYCIRNGLEAQLNRNFPDVIFEVCMIDPTKNQCETIQRTLEILSIDESFAIKDCDNYFSCSFMDENAICYSNLDEFDLVNAANKSYIQINEHNIATNIVEKQIISTSFCVGLYSFSSSREFLTYWKTIQDDAKQHDVPLKDLYISHIIHRMMMDNHHFQPVYAQNYLDWGTLEDWQRYKSDYSTLFIDLDGVLVENSSEFMNPKWGDSNGIQENIDAINRLYDSGKVLVIITTARNSRYEEQTLKQLNRCGIKYHRVIFDLLHCKRIIVNDFSKTNTYPSCKAVNLPRNATMLGQLIGD